jgi:VWFA-related protein
MKRLAMLVAVVVLLTSFSAALAQAPASALPKNAPPAMLSLVVTDSKGHHVPSLSKDDVQLSIGGEPAELAKFVERGAGGTPAGEMRRIAVLFDVASLSAGARRKAADALRGFLTRTLRPGDLVVILGGGQSLRAMTSWTNNPAAIDKALERVCGEALTPLANSQAEAEKRIREIATDIQQADANQHTLYSFDALMDAARAYAAASYRDAELSLDVISSAVSLFRPRTRNVLVVVGGSLPRKPGDGVFQYVETIRTSALRGQRGVAMQTGAQYSSPMGESSNFDLTPLFASVGTRSWRRGLAIYTITSEVSKDSGGGSEMGQAADSLAAFTNEAGRSGGYRLLADETGGVAFVGRSASDALERIASDLESFYSAGVHPSAPISGMGDVAVKVRKGYSVRVLRGSAGSGTPVDEMESRVVANHLVRPADNELGISLNAAPAVPDGEKRLVTVDVLIPINKLKLVPDGDTYKGEFTVFVSTGDQFGNSSRVNRQLREVRWPAAALNQAGDKKLTFRVNVVLEPGRSQISIGVMDEHSREKGFDRVSVL